MDVDHDRVDDAVGRVAGDHGAAFHVATTLVADRLGLHAPMRGSRPVSPSQPAERTARERRSPSPWLALVGRLCYPGSALICIPNSPRQDVGFRRAAETSFNLVHEVRP